MPMPNGPVLLGDIGGTNARFGLAIPGHKPSAVKVLAVKDFQKVDNAISTALTQLGVETGDLSGAYFAVAGPVSSDRARLTNHSWTFVVANLQKALKSQNVGLFNDFSAMAAALPVLTGDDLETVTNGQSKQGFAKLAFGPGTGLGVAGLIPYQDDWMVIPGEGGHIDLAASTEAEWSIIQTLRQEYQHVSIERVLSGPGISLLYRVISQVPASAAPVDPSDIAAKARAGDPEARRVFALFSAWLGAAAGDLALAFGALGGVYICGGIVPKLRGLFDRNMFRSRFLAKGRFRQYLETIPIHIVQAPFPALQGLSRLALRAGRIGQ